MCKYYNKNLIHNVYKPERPESVDIPHKIIVSMIKILQCRDSILCTKQINKICHVIKSNGG